ELYYMPSPDAPPQRLTSFNDSLAALDLGRVESIEWQGPDRWPEDGVLIYPPGFDARRTYPMVLLIHGGPQAASTESFSTFGQLMAARGYIVFQPNYRGSDNLGNAYQRAIVNDAGAGPGRDVMAGLKVVKERGSVDASRIGVSGWSYRLYHALKDNGVDTRFVAWPVPGHFPSDPVRMRSVYREWIGWLDAHLNPTPEGTPASDKKPQKLPDEVKPAPAGASEH